MTVTNEKRRDRQRPVDAARWLPWVVLGLLILFHALANVLWLQQDGRSLYGDTGNHARASMAIFQALRDPGPELLMRINQATTFWPPVGYLLTEPLYALLGVSSDVTSFTTTLWFALAIVGAYLIGRRLYDWRTGLLAAFIFSFYPAIYLQSRTYYVDMALTALVLITLICLLRTEDFSRRRASLLFGLALGVAALTKNAFIIMTIGPLLVVVARALLANGRAAWRQLLAWQPGSRLAPAGHDLAQRLLNMALAGLIAALLAAPWYISHLGILAFNAGEVTRDVHLAAKPVTWYLLKFDEGLLIWPYILLLVGLAVGLLRWRQRGNWFTLLWLASGVAIITMVTRQNVRYLLPVLPAAALLSAAWIVGLRRRGLAAALVAVTALFQVTLFFVMSWGAPAAWNQALHVPVQDAHNPFNDRVTDRPLAIDPLAFLYYQYPPKPHRWPVQAIVDAVIADIEASGQADQVNRFVSLSKLLDFEYSTFAYEAELARVQGRPGAINLEVGDVPQRDSYLTDFLDFDYVLVKSDDRSTLANRQNHRATRDLWNRGDGLLRERFTPLLRWELQDGSTAELFKRAGPPLAQLSPQELRPILRRVLELSPENGYAQRLLALLDSANPAWQTNAAIQHWRGVLRARPDDATAWQQLVDLLLIADPPAALTELQQALQRAEAGPTGGGPKFPATRLVLQRELGRVWEALGDPAQAEAAYLAALQLAPHDAVTQASAGAFFLRQGEAARAAEQFSALASRYPPPAAPISATAPLTPALIAPAAPLSATTAITGSETPPVDAAPDLAALLASQAAAASEDPMTQVRLGAWALQQGASPAQAAEHFQAALALDPTAWLAYGLWANSLGSTGQVTQALQIVDRGLQALPDNLGLQAMQARWQGTPDAAAGDDYRAALAAGRSAIGQRAWEEALAAAQQAVALAPARYEAQQLLGDAQRGLEAYDAALLAYQQAAELAPTMSALHGRQAEMLVRLGRVDEAAAAALTALAIDQGRWESWYALGLAFSARALDPEAGAAADETARQAAAFLARAQTLAPAGNQSPARSLAELRAGLRRAAASVAADATPAQAAARRVDFAAMSAAERAAVRAQADEALRAGRPGQALVLYQQLAAVEGQEIVDDRVGVAEALAALRLSDQALAEFGAISVTWPDFPLAYIRQGALLEEQGATEAALTAYRAAVSRAPQSADAHLVLAYALARAGRGPEALAAFEDALALDPTRSEEQPALQALIDASPP
ncbi:MAG: glycosyltransferase family 39 protein [Anaerolinea sp.]|nr:glycosyltransferase family 39 protein [Anaerolinea sp.]